MYSFHGGARRAVNTDAVCINGTTPLSDTFLRIEILFPIVSRHCCKQQSLLSFWHNITLLVWTRQKDYYSFYKFFLHTSSAPVEKSHSSFVIFIVSMLFFCIIHIWWSIVSDSEKNRAHEIIHRLYLYLFQHIIIRFVTIIKTWKTFFYFIITGKSFSFFNQHCLLCQNI